MKDETHEQSEKEKSRDIGAEGDEVRDGGIDLIGGEETEGEREDDKIAKSGAEEEHEIAREDGTECVATFGSIESGSDETEEDEEDVGRDGEKAKTERHLDVDEELLRQFGIDEMRMVFGERACERSEAAEGDEIGAEGSQHEREEPLTEIKSDQGGHKNRPQDA